MDVKRGISDVAGNHQRSWKTVESEQKAPKKGAKKQLREVETKDATDSTPVSFKRIAPSPVEATEVK